MANGDPTTEVIWITRARTTVAHVRGLLQGLEQAGALDYAEVRIMALDENSAVSLPDVPYTLPDGTTIRGSDIATIDNLPPQGLVIVPAPGN